MQYSQPCSRSARPVRTRSLMALAVTAVLAGCASVTPLPLEPQTTQEANRADALALRADVPPITGPLTLEEALARALKYNLDRRVKLLEEAIAHRQLDLSFYDMS